MSQGQQQGNQQNLAAYRKRFAELKVSNDRQRGLAPYKPILLLSVIDLIAQGIIKENRIPVSDDLLNLFDNYWDILGSKSRPGGLVYPFLYLESENFWHLSGLKVNKRSIKSHKKLRESVEYASLDATLFDLLQDPLCRGELIDTLVSVWFSTNQKQLEDILQINQNFQDSVPESEIIGESEILQNQPRVILRKSLIRNAFFRKAVVHTYDYRCAFCQLRIIRSISQNIVDGAHIKPFSQFYDNNIENGISLCKNHHWAFDMGWFAIDSDYRILVSRDLEEESPYAKPMKDFHKELILLPSSDQHFPSHEALKWHRLNVFRA